MTKDRTGKRAKDGGRVVLLRDLAPRENVRGGSGKLLFGERQGTRDDAPQPKKLSQS